MNTKTLGDDLRPRAHWQKPPTVVTSYPGTPNPEARLDAAEAELFTTRQNLAGAERELAATKAKLAEAEAKLAEANPPDGAGPQTAALRSGGE
jgi:hypothetical protein